MNARATPMRVHPLAVRLFLLFLAANLLTLAVSVVATRVSVRALESSEALDARAHEAHLIYRQQGTAALLAKHREWRAKGEQVYLFERGQPLLGQPKGPVKRRWHELQGSERQELRLPRGEVLVSLPLEPELRAIVLREVPHGPRLRGWLPLAIQLALTTAILALAGYFAARTLTAPLQTIQNAVSRFAGGDLASRVGLRVKQRSDGIGALAHDFDRMADQIQKLVGDRDRLLHDVSHELRAPLARLRFVLELARGERAGHTTLARADAEIARMDELLGQLLDASRLERAQPALAPLDVAVLARDVLAACGAAQGKAVHLDYTGPDECLLYADEAALRQALENLLRNAIQYSPENGRIRVSLSINAAESCLSVEDQGPGVPAAELGRLFEPFYRGSQAEPGQGHGLGLSLVARAMRLHGGSASAENLSSGGLRVLLRWPVKISAAS